MLGPSVARAARRIRSLVIPVLLAACELDGSGPLEPASVAAVEIVTAGAIVLPWDGTVALRAIARDAAGQVVTGRAVSWTSAADSVAVVTAGVVQARGPGAADVVAEIDGVTGAVEVRVLEAPLASIRVTGTTALSEGDVVAWGAVPVRADGREAAVPVHWRSSDPRVVSVTTGPLGIGMIAAHLEGDAVITATAAEIGRSIPVRVRGRVEGR